VYSRRSGGLSLGINLFPDEKRCSFDCPYCEVFPFKTGVAFSLEELEQELRRVLSGVGKDVPVKDFCFSGNGEPSLSPHLPAALDAVARICGDMDAELVLISNGTGLLDKRIFDLLCRSVHSLGLKIWLKLDAGTPAWYGQMARSSVSFERLLGAIRDFVRVAPVTIQTMLCAINGAPPPEDEVAAWERLVLDLAREPGPGLRMIQLYGKARPAPQDPLATALPASYLEARALSLSKALEAAGLKLPVGVFL
jgi:histidinol dehydrogenase